MISRGHAVSIAGPPDTPLLREAEQRGIEAVPLQICKKRLAGLLAIRRLLKSREFDVVNTHSSTDSWLTALACATLRRPPKIVRTRHVSTPVRPTLANRWLFGKACAAVVTTGEAVREMLIRDLKLDPAKVISVPTGVDSEIYHPVSAEEKVKLRQILGLPQNQVIVGTVATLRFLKGIEYLFEAIRLLNDERVLLCVVGDGPQRQRLESWIQDNGMQKKIMMVGEQRNVNEWLQSFDIFAFPSLAEGVPQALAQAMLTELPCVTTNVGGIPELAIHGETALVIEPKAAPKLAENIQIVINDPEFADNLGKQSRGFCGEKHSVNHMSAHMERVFYEATTPAPDKA
jgi:glycosyltransferase involved in cell wall biosynthesis